MSIWKRGSLHLGQRQTSETEYLPWKLEDFSILYYSHFHSVATKYSHKYTWWKKIMQTDVHPLVYIWRTPLILHHPLLAVCTPCMFSGGHLVRGAFWGLYHGMLCSGLQVPNWHPLWSHRTQNTLGTCLFAFSYSASLFSFFLFLFLFNKLD